MSASPSPTPPEPQASPLINPPQIIEIEEHSHMSASSNSTAPEPTRQIVESEEHSHMSASPSSTAPESKALPRLDFPQIVEIERPEGLEAVKRPPTNRSGTVISPTSSGIQSATARYFLMSNIPVILKVLRGDYTIKPARQDLFEMAMKPFHDIPKPTLTFGDHISNIPIEIHAIQDHSVWTAEELYRFLMDGKAPKPYNRKHWDELLGTYRPADTYSNRRSVVKLFVTNAILCYMAPEFQSQAQASKLAVSSLIVSTGPQAILDHTRSMDARAFGGTYIRQIPPAGKNRKDLAHTQPLMP